MEKKFKQKLIHVAKEALCVTICGLGVNDKPYPLIVFPICSHELTETESTINEISMLFGEIIPTGQIVNIATDGDHYRRKVLKSMRLPSEKTNLSNLKFFSTDVVLVKFSVNLDIKHLVKRIRGILISEKRNITMLSRQLNRQLLIQLLPECVKYMNPRDYQNVPFAVNLLQQIVAYRDKHISNVNFLQNDAFLEIKCLAEIVSPLLNVFVNPKINLFDQLVQLAYCSHLLFFIYRKWKTRFITSQLYYDIQCTIQDAFCVAEAYNFKNPKKSCFFTN